MTRENGYPDGLAWDAPGVLTLALADIEQEWREYQEWLDHNEKSERKGYPDDPDDDITF